jgi:hypothetical protein
MLYIHTVGCLNQEINLYRKGLEVLHNFSYISEVLWNTGTLVYAASAN